ncbi:hypothetical protein N0B31_22360 (plasmid) [Salinirubellus salinus]|uniref:Uncharacterized protein n=1 Tax=Salinirubellus salinus TaxID=1364945 RepID=A0A9E7R7K2_9EURY|nr:hypothetical protein [Salinirubellus salinus]UWM56992.1 hypothetical protein N0B31_22360 [Salinirubellus salinus]
MTDTTTFSVKVDADVCDRFRDAVREENGKLRGELGRTVESLMLGYVRTRDSELAAATNAEILAEIRALRKEGATLIL